MEKDTLTGTLNYAGQRVAMGTMVYKHESACDDPADCARKLAKTAMNLKPIPCVTGGTRICVVTELAMVHPPSRAMRSRERLSATGVVVAGSCQKPNGAMD